MKPEKKSENVRTRTNTPRNKGNNNNILIIAVAAIILIGAYALLIGDQQKTEQNLTLKEVRALIEKENGNKATGTETPPVKDNYIPVLAPRMDLSALSLPDNFKSIADGLKFTPAGVNRAYFINTKMLSGTEMEYQILKQVEPDGFYGKKLIGMYSADFAMNSWIELHDMGYDSTNDATIKGKIEPGMKNIVTTRPLIYGHSQNVDNVLGLINDPDSMNSSYYAYKPLLDAVDYQNVAYAIVHTEKNNFSDINYESQNPQGAKVELVKAYRFTDNKSIPAAFDRYNPQITGDIVVIKVTGDPKTIQLEKDNIDSVARP